MGRPIYGMIALLEVRCFDVGVVVVRYAVRG
jgi:hypothetical protein